LRAEKYFAVWFSTGFARVIHRISTVTMNFIRMSSLIAWLVVLLLLTNSAAASAASDATLFRIFLRDGSTVVSYGEFARVGDDVVFSMPVGGPADDPRLHVVSLPTSAIDWSRTDRYAASARYQQYAQTRGENDFQLLSSDIARVLNEIALSNDKLAALNSAQQARRTLADWPAAHYGYRERDVREVVSLLDEAISDLRASAGLNDFAVSLVATPAEAGVMPLLGTPTLRDQIDQTFRVAALTGRVPDRVALLQEALALLNEADSSIPKDESQRLRQFAQNQIRAETFLDKRYATLSRRLVESAASAAGEARIADVQRILNQVSKEDAKLGGRRPDVIQALNAAIQIQLENARHLRLLRDQWIVRRASFREYQRAVGADLLQLVKIQPTLEAIRRLDGPVPSTLVRLRGRLDGGADRLGHLTVPDHLRATHELLVGAWRFAETAVDTRYDAVSSGNVSIAWQASSSAAAALLMVDRVQRDIRALLDPPRLQ